MKKLPFDDPGTPDTRSPARFLLWVGSKQLSTLALGMTFVTVRTAVSLSASVRTSLAMSQRRPSSDAVLVRPVTACLVAV